MKRKSSFIAIGLMLFALFFGAGNLIFPPFLGQHAGANTVPATVGFVATGCGLPLLAVVAVCRSGSDLHGISSRVAPWYGLFMVIAVALTLGPCFAIPRNGSTSFEMTVAPFIDAEYTAPALFAYSLVFFLLSWWLAITPSKLVDRVGKVLTPIMLVLLAALFAAYAASPFGAWQTPADAKYASTALAFTSGIMEGYNTMDIFSGLLFSILIVETLREDGITGRQQIAMETLRSGLIAMFFMCIIYVFLCFIGASSVLPLGIRETGAPILLGAMRHYFGAAGPLLLSVVVFLACLTTNIGLIASIAALFSRLFPRLTPTRWATLFSVLSFVIANFGLAAIIKASVPVLVFLYPMTIVLIALTFLHDFFGGSPLVHRTATLFTFFPALYDGLAAVGLAPSAITSVMQHLPLAAHGLSWVPVSAAGLALGWVLHLVLERK